MSEPRFLTVEQVESLQKKAIEVFGGLHGVRDRTLVEGAVLQPRNVYFYEQGDLFDIASAYVFYVAQAQAFLDGNKRAGMAAALVFLELNGIIVPECTDVLYSAMIEMAEKKVSRIEIATLLRSLAAA